MTIFTAKIHAAASVMVFVRKSTAKSPLGELDAYVKLPADMYRLVFQSRDANRPPLTGDAGTLVIGRAASCGLQLTEAGVRDQHATIERRADGYYLRDLVGSRSVRVNDQAVGDQRLQSGDELEIGAIRLRFEIVLDAVTGRRAFDLWQTLAGLAVLLLVAGQLGFFGWIFAQPHPRNTKLDIVKGKPVTPPPVAPATPAALPALIPLTPAPAAPAPTVGLSRRLKINKVDPVKGPADVTLRIQVKAQVGERELNSADVSVKVYCFTTATKPPLTQTLPGPANWENFSSRQLTARFVIPPAQYAGYVVRTYYRNQLQDVDAAPPNLAALVP